MFWKIALPVLTFVLGVIATYIGKWADHRFDWRKESRTNQREVLVPLQAAVADSLDKSMTYWLSAYSIKEHGTPISNEAELFKAHREAYQTLSNLIPRVKSDETRAALEEFSEHIRLAPARLLDDSGTLWITEFLDLDREARRSLGISIRKLDR